MPIKQGSRITMLIAASAALTAAAAPAAAAPGDFTTAPGSPFAGADDAIDLVTADFNGDGDGDLASANNIAPGSVSILLGDGTGGLAPAPTSPEAAGSSPESIATGQLDADADFDLAVGNETGGNVTILLNQGAGDFSAGTSVSAGSNPSDVAVGRLNADLLADLAITNRGSDNVTIALGNGDGTFTPAAGSPEAAGDGAESVTITNVDGDADQDLAVMNANAGTISILLNNGAGDFAAAASSPETAPGRDIAAGGIDGAAGPDLVTAGNAGITTLLNNGSGDYSAASGSPEAVGNARGLALSDFNADAKLDVATSAGPEVPVLLGDGAGDFTQPASSPEDLGAETFGIAVAELGGDSNPDLATPNFSADTVSVLINNPINRTLTLKYKNGPKAFAGKLGSADPDCVGGQDVSVFRKRGSGDKLIGTDAANAAGKYSVPGKPKRGKYFARAESAPEADGGFCNARQSAKLKLR